LIEKRGEARHAQPPFSRTSRIVIILELRAQIGFFFACCYGGRGDRTRAGQHPRDADVRTIIPIG
jgi:hypothetical protein